MKLGPINFAFALFAVVCCASAASSNTPTQQQYHTQDDLGQYAYGYAEPHSAKQEVRSLDGITRGSYSYRDGRGKLQTVDYTADDNGFRVIATNFPNARVVPSDQQQQPFRAQQTSGGSSSAADVAAVRAIDTPARQESVLRLSARGNFGGKSVAAASDSGLVQLPKPVADTVAVAAAKADHLRRHEDEKQLHEFIHQGRVISPISSTVIPSVYHYGYPLKYYYY